MHLNKYTQTLFVLFFNTLALSLLLATAKAQPIAEKHFTQLLKFDSLVFIDDAAANASGKKPKTKVTGDTCYLNFYDRESNQDTFTLLKINIHNKHFSKQSFVITGLHLLMEDGRVIVNDFDINSTHLTLLVDHTLFIHALQNNKTSKVNFDAYSGYEQVKLFSSYLVLAKSYDTYNPFRKVVKTEVALFDLASQKITKTIQPTVNDIELTHTPVKPITFFNDKIIVAQNNSYSFTVYDSLLNIVQTVTDYKILQHTFNAEKLRKLNGRNSSALFSYLGENFFKYGLLESIKPVNENTFVVRYHNGDKKYTDCRLLDIWQRDSTDDEYKFTGTTYLSDYIQHHNTLAKDSAFIYNKDNYFEYTEDAIYWQNNKMVRISMEQKVYPLGYSLKQLSRIKKDLYTKTKPVVCVSFFNVIY
ncbi:MAG: hypothetical protein V4538_00405 [Bacteroidota bacterium]